MNANPHKCVRRNSRLKTYGLVAISTSIKDLVPTYYKYKNYYNIPQCIKYYSHKTIISRILDSFTQKENINHIGKLIAGISKPKK
ncbi:MAG: hypothetical protein ACTSUG_02055 [Candidatus Helarchaeota archaeon]